ncbi:MAG: thiamine phosphate synthase [Bacteroidales bacterium]|nr:thiamine phosphate synthase [Bacteroidales bacterium]
MEEIGIYVIITNPVLSYEKIAEVCVKKQIRMLQLREKSKTDKELIKIAKTLRKITQGTKTQLVINDRPDIAAICGADFVHLGQDDIEISDVRNRFPDLKIGLSTHSLAQAKDALAHNPDYIAFGPIYSTNAKVKPDPPVGTKLLNEVIQMSHIPVVAIGGLYPENIEEVILAGATNFAFIRYLMNDTDLEVKIDNLQNIIKALKNQPTNIS